MMECSRYKVIAALLAVISIVGLGVSSLRAHDHLVVVVMAKSSRPYEEVMTGFRSYLQSQGIKAHFDINTIDGDTEELDRILDYAESNDAKLIFTIGAAATEWVTRKEIDIPVVYSLVLHEIRSNNADVTGVTMEFSVSSQLMWMKRFLPKARKVGVLYNPESNGERIVRAKIEAKKIGVELEAEAVEKPQDIPGALQRLEKKVDVLWGIPDNVVLNPQTAKQLLLFCYRYRIPFVGPSKAWVKAGALYALDRNYTDIGSQCGEIAMSIFSGTSPRDIDSQSPDRTVYFVNLKTARHMKVNIDKELLAAADGVY